MSGRGAPQLLDLDLEVGDVDDLAKSQGANSQEGTPKKLVKIEIDSSTYIKTKFGPEKMANCSYFLTPSLSLASSRTLTAIPEPS